MITFINLYLLKEKRKLEETWFKNKKNNFLTTKF